MTVIESQQKIIQEFAAPVIKRLIKKVIRNLQRLDITMSGVENGNTWDDICIQVQSQLSSFWPQYEAAIDGFIETELKKLALHEKTALWFQTEEGKKAIADELFNLEEKEGMIGNEESIYNEAKVLEFLYLEILTKAGEYNNKRIREYLG